MKRKLPFHPLLFAAYPVLSLYSENTSIIPIGDLWLPLGIVILGAVTIWLVLAALLRNIRRAALGTSVGMILLFGYGPLADVLKVTYREPNFYGFFGIWTLGFIGLVVLACWPWRFTKDEVRFGTWTGALNMTSLLLGAIPVVSIGLSWFKGVESIGSTPNPLVARFHGTRPDIFYIILDGFGRQDALKRDMGLDDSEFIDGLKKRGFYLAESGHTNYCQTELSLSSSLNMGFLPEVVPHFSAKHQDRSILDVLIDKNVVSKTLRDFGYGYVAVVTGFPAVHPRSADILIGGETSDSLFHSAVLARTPFPSNSEMVTSMFDSRREDLKVALQTIGELGQAGSRPRFIFAHILAPHPPFVLGPNGESLRPRGAFGIVDGSHFYQHGGTMEEYRKGYSGQATYIGKLTLQAIDTLLSKETTPPIVIVQGDHGPKMRYDQEELGKSDINEVFPNLNAYLVPPEVKAKLYPTITPVNSFRAIFREHFGLDLPNLPDRSWYSSWTWPFELQEVTDRIRPHL